MKSISWEVKGMNCVGCSNAVKNLLQSLGAEEIHVDFSSGEVNFINSSNQANEHIIKEIEKLGYSVVLPDEPKKKDWTLSF